MSITRSITRSIIRPITRRDFLVRSGGALATGSLFGNRVIGETARSLAGQSPAGDTLYVDASSGADSNPGTREKPLKTLAEAANRVNPGKGTGPTTVILGEGLYLLDRTVLFKPGRQYTAAERLTIRAESLPDDPDWTPARMPVLLPVMPLSKTLMGRPDPFGGVAYGIQVETSHVSIQGFKILGMPHYEFPAKGQIHRVYPIAREGDALEDLEIKQCFFAGDPVALPNHCGILARGHGIVVDHCLFHRCKVTVVFWGAQGGTAHGDAMRNCLALDSYGCGLWTTQPGDDFEFRNNVISGSLYAWIREASRHRYRVTDSVFAGNKNLVGSGAGPALNFKTLDPAIMELPKSIPVVDKPVQVEMDETRRNFLHVLDGTLGSELSAGLFSKRA
jgi:hypothetical protein